MDIAPVDGATIRFDRRLDGEVVTTLVNVTSAPVAWPGDLDGNDVEVLLSTSPDRTGPGSPLGADEAVVLGRRPSPDQMRSK